MMYCATVDGSLQWSLSSVLSLGPRRSGGGANGGVTQPHPLSAWGRVVSSPDHTHRSSLAKGGLVTNVHFLGLTFRFCRNSIRLQNGRILRNTNRSLFIATCMSGLAASSSCTRDHWPAPRFRLRYCAKASTEIITKSAFV